MDGAQIFPAVRVDDHRRIQRWWRLIVPEEEVFSISFEGNFDQVGQPLLQELAHTQKFIPATAHEFVRLVAAQIFNLLDERIMHRLWRSPDGRRARHPPVPG